MTVHLAGELVAEILSLIAAVVLLVPALRVIVPLRGFKSVVDDLLKTPRDENLDELIKASVPVIEAVAMRWKPVDYWCLVIGLAIQAIGSILKVTVLIVR